MSAWGSSFRSCDPLIERVEKNDPTVVDLVILPTKTFQDSHVDRLADILREGQTTHLRTIQASGHAISNDSLRRLGQAIATGKSKLTSLAVGDSNMGDEGVCSLCQGLMEGNCSTLISIDFSYKGMGPTGLQSVIRLAAESEALSSINLSRNPGLVDESTIADEQSPIFTNIKDLDLSDCDIGGDTGTKFMRRLASSNDQRTLRLSHNPLGDLPAKELVGRHLPSLKELHLQNCNVGDDCWRDAPVVNSALRVLDLSSNGLTAQGVSFLGKALCSMPQLAELNLSGNALHESGIESLIALLRNRNALVPLSLDLSDTNCTARAACVAVESLDNISSLRLFNNNLGSQGFQSMAVHLRGGHPVLHTLDLAGNHASEAAVVKLLSSLLETGDFESKLKTLVVGGNAGGQALENMIHSIKMVRPELDIARDRIRKRQ